MDYNFKKIENKCRKFWIENETDKIPNENSKPKCYVLDMFPYPSGEGLHVGHPLGYIASDIYSRFKRLKGFNVLHPMGFDAFGLPAEQYAVETGQHPAVTTSKNIEVFKSQLVNIGLCYDWSREVRTCDPAFYKWTQSLFLKIYHSWYNKQTDKAEHISSLIKIFESEGNKNVQSANSCDKNFSADEWKKMPETDKEKTLLEYRLAYLAYATVNWCPELGTVLANDEVKDGLSERGGYPVEKMKLRQWFLRITAYADRLFYGLDDVDFPESLKEMQRNWIGRSEGATMFFPIKDHDEKLEIFTTRADTIFGATFMVIAPEHPLVEQLTTSTEKSKVEDYLKYVKSRSDIERQAEKKVTGVFTGSYAVNPFNQQQIPIWIAEYVLIGYGSGAIMAVPADDERDFAFAEKFDLPVIEVIDRSEFPDASKEDKVGKLKNSEFLNGLNIPDAIDKIVAEMEAKKFGFKTVNYKLHDAGFSRQRYWGEPFPIVYKDDVPFPIDEKELPLILPEVESYKPSGKPESPLAQNKDWVNLPDGTKRETDTMPGYAGSSWYFLRYMDPHNTERFVDEKAEKYWGQVDLYIGGAEHAVGHLMYSRFWHKVLFDLGMVSTEEPYKKLVNQGMIQGKSSLVYRIKDTNTFVSKGLTDQYEVTPIHVNVNFVENDVLNINQFKQWRAEFNDAEFILEDNKYICGSEVEKMSKRWHNTVNPDDVVKQYGADCFRMYEMFLGPIEQHKPWDTQGIDGVSKFLRKFWRLFYDESGKLIVTTAKPTEEEQKILHKTIKKVEEDIDRLSFNTGVSALMICVNELTSLNCNKKEILSKLLIVIAPYAPFIAEELWDSIGNDNSIFTQLYPEVNESLLVESSYTYPVSINGKVRDRIELPLDIKRELVQQKIMELEKVIKHTEGKPIRKVIYVPGKIINVVI